MMWPLTWNQTSWSVNSLQTKLVEVDGIPAELFQILKSDVVKVLHSTLPANLENSAVTTGLQKSVFIPNSKKGNTKDVQTTTDLLSFLMQAK